MTFSKNMINKIRKEWKDLGFYYDRNDEDFFWLIMGSKDGILKFCNILLNFSKSNKITQISEDEHFGPYSYLKLMSWIKPEITKGEIRGNRKNFEDLSRIIKEKLNKNETHIEINKEFSADNTYIIKIIIKEDNFDPASPDSNLI